jgi:hypothetical protein
VIVNDDSNLVVDAREVFVNSGRGDSKRAIHIKHAQQGILLVYIQARSAGGKLVHRTFMTQTRNQPVTIKPFTLYKTNVNEAGDVVLAFRGIDKPHQPVKIHARLGIKVFGLNEAINECVDVAAFVEDNTSLVHNEWLRRCIREKTV